VLHPDITFNTNLFIAATLAATSVGITADVMHDMGRSKTIEGRIVLGAAVGDDILGLILLAIVSGIVVSGSVNVLEIVSVTLTSILFLIAVVVLGPGIVRATARVMRRLDIVEAKMFTSYLFVMLLAWMANLVGLATIIGAFAAGTILSDAFFRHAHKEEKVVSIRELIMPLEVILVPIFFILMGIQVKLEAFFSWPVVVLAIGLLVAGVAGKLVCGLGAGNGADRLVVGVGMVPRGEVGLVFAAIGKTLGVINDAVFSAIALMIIVTTLIAPPWLKLAINRQAAREEEK
jgi:Kef-type K+ transport system membrane component KefB